jgi:integrase
MASLKLTEACVRDLAATGKAELWWDASMHGFGVAISKTGIKSYVAQSRVNGLSRRVTLERWSPGRLAEARTRAVEIIAGMSRGEDPKGKVKPVPALTLQTALDDYITRVKLRERTKEIYCDNINRYLGDWLALPLRSITDDMVEERHAAIVGIVTKRARKLVRPGATPETGAASADLCMRALRAVWNFAGERDKNLPTSPTTLLRRQWFGTNRRTRTVPTGRLAEFYKGVQALANPIGRDAVLLLMFTGMRRNEACGLRWSEVDWASSILRIPSRRMKVAEPFKLPMNDLVHSVLADCRARGHDRSGFVFSGQGKAGHLVDIRYYLDIVAEQTGIVVSPHDLRRTFLSVAAGCPGVSPIALKALVAHASTDVTVGYVQIEEEELRAAAQRVADRLKELCKIRIPDPCAALGVTTHHL